MKIHAIISFLCLASVALGTSCKDDETHFLQRSHDALSFPYLNSTKELLVLTNGSWKITPDDTWISCSPGEGNGAPKEQAVNITVAQNDGAERTGSITLSDGLKELVIRVTQEDGFFTVGSPEIAPSFDLYEELVDKRVTIPYQKSKPGYKADVTATLEGAGAEGIAIESLSGYEMEAGDGAIPLALSGTPTKKGPITVKLHVEISSVATPYDLTAESRAKLAGEVTVTMFKLLPRLAVLDWGDYEKGTGTNFNNGTPRSFSFGLALEEEGDNLRNYTSKTANWLTASSMFFVHNRFAFGNLQPGTTYWFWIVAHELGPNKEDSDKTWFSFTTPEENLAPNVILYKDFDDFWFRGCPIYQAFGVEVTNAQIGANIDPDDPNCPAATGKIVNPVNSTDSFFNYVGSATDNRGPVKAAKLWEAWWEGDTYGTNYADADYPGWQGFWVRTQTGAALLSTASVSGYIKTPKLTGIGEGTADITVTCHTAPYFEPYHSWGQDHEQHYIQVEGPGTITDGGPTKAEPTGAATANTDKQVTVQCTTHVDSNKIPTTDYVNPTEHVVKISGATKETRIVIAAHPYGTKHYRLWIDDIQVTKDR